MALPLACVAVVGCGGTGHTSLPGADRQNVALVSPASSPGGPFRFFSSDSFWNEPLATDAPLDPKSGTIIAAFEQEIATEQQDGTGPTINSARYSVPIYTVPEDQPTVRVTLTAKTSHPTLQAAFDAVPLPPNAQPAYGPDKHLVVWQPSTDRLWEFWRLSRGSDGWQADWGGAMRDVSSNPGVYGPEAWPGAEPWWGGSASSLSLAGGLVTMEDLQRGVINHALALAIPHVRAGEYSSPAHRDDGTTQSPLALPEGAHLRLEPSLDLASLHLPHLTLMLAEAAQRYGIFVRSGSSYICFYAQDPIPTGTDPYTGPDGFLEGRTPVQAVASFPWSHLQLLRMHLHPYRPH